MYAPPLRYKREALAVHYKHTQTHAGLSTRHAKAHSDSSNTAQSGRRVLRSGGPNHSKLAVFIVFFQEIELVLANPRRQMSWL